MLSLKTAERIAYIVALGLLCVMAYLEGGKLWFISH
jgi:hypothetical protein